MAVIIARVRGVRNPKVIRAYIDIGDVAVVFDRSFMRNPQAAEGKYAGGGTSVALALDGGITGVLMQSQAPYEPIFAESALVGPQYTNPLAVTVFFHYREGDVRVVPAIGNADNGLCAICRHGGIYRLNHQ